MLDKKGSRVVDGEEGEGNEREIGRGGKGMGGEEGSPGTSGEV